MNKIIIIYSIFVSALAIDLYVNYADRQPRIEAMIKMSEFNWMK